MRNVNQGRVIPPLEWPAEQYAVWGPIPVPQTRETTMGEFELVQREVADTQPMELE